MNEEIKNQLIQQLENKLISNIHTNIELIYLGNSLQLTDNYINLIILLTIKSFKNITIFNNKQINKLLNISDKIMLYGGK